VSCCHSRALALAAGVFVGGPAALAQTAPSGVSDQTRVAPFEYVGGMQPVMDNTVFTHVLLEQAEDRWNGRDHSFRYDGQGWTGTDYNKLWLKSEGTVTNRGRFTDGQHEVLYDRAVSTFFDVQAGARVDLDSERTRTWARTRRRRSMPARTPAAAVRGSEAEGCLANSSNGRNRPSRVSMDTRPRRRALHQPSQCNGPNIDASRSTSCAYGLQRRRASGDGAGQSSARPPRLLP